MRSFMKSSAIALFTVSAIGGNALAAADASNGAPTHKATTGAMTTVKVIPPRSKAHPAELRLHHVLAELRMQSRRIERDRRQGHLNLADYHLLRNEKHHIRTQAMQIAGRHDGKISRHAYVALQASMKQLNGNIRRMLTV